MKKILFIIACFLCVTIVNAQGFIKAEDFFDSDPGINNGIPITVSTTSASLSQGFHFLGLRVKHNDDVWSLFETRRFYISALLSADVANIVAAEYFIDNDP